jgi:hypothetical protein
VPRGERTIRGVGCGFAMDAPRYEFRWDLIWQVNCEGLPIIEYISIVEIKQGIGDQVTGFQMNLCRGEAFGLSSAQVASSEPMHATYPMHTPNADASPVRELRVTIKIPALLSGLPRSCRFRGTYVRGITGKVREVRHHSQIPQARRRTGMHGCHDRYKCGEIER